MGERLPERFAKQKEPKLVNLRNASRREAKKGDCQQRVGVMTVGCLMSLSVTAHSSSGSQPGAISFPGGQVAMSGDISGHHSLQGRILLLASNEERQVVLGNILQFTGQPFMAKSHPA